MSANEGERLKRFHVESARLQYCATRILIRTVLSQYANVSPSEWQFGRSENGKPVVCGPGSIDHLYFNLSNTSGMVAAAVSRRTSQLGIDVETQRQETPLNLVNRVVTEDEWRRSSDWFRTAPEECVLAHWTMKESLAKALDLAFDEALLSSTSFDFSKTPIALDASAQGKLSVPACWNGLYEPSAEHILALCIGTSLPPTVAFYDFEVLRSSNLCI